MRENFPDAHPVIDTYLLNFCLISGEKREKIELVWDSNSRPSNQKSNVLTANHYTIGSFLEFLTI